MGNREQDSVLVVGLGRQAISGTLSALERLEHEVLVVDASLELVQDWSGAAQPRRAG